MDRKLYLLPVFWGYFQTIMVASIRKLEVVAALFAIISALLLAACNSAATGGSGGGTNPPIPPPDTPTPVFGIISPDNASTVIGSKQIVVEMDNIDVSSVEVSLDGSATPVCTLTEAPYTCLVDLSTFDVGTAHTVTAEGIDGGSVVATDTINLVRAAFENNICKTASGGDTTLVTCLSDLYSQGLAAENFDDQYENRDGDHTVLNISLHPQTTYIHGPYGTTGIGTTPQNSDPETPLTGNASLCYNAGAGWCEGTARYLIRTGGANTLYNLYTGSNFYWFPEHTDHDAEDLAYYMVPFVNSSQGSSGSEMDEVGKWLYTLAAFTPETKSALLSSGTLMPTIQMLFRRTRVASDTEYLSGLAHANAFENASNTYSMVRTANNMSADAIPPMVQLEVVEDTFDAASGEVAFTTPVAIARRWRTEPDTPRRITVSAENSFDPNGLPLSFHWRLIRGDPDHVRITPQGENGATAEIEIDFHDAELIQIGSEERLSTLVSVAVFAHNGYYFSAPAFITSSTWDYVP